jgi:hypothetical protein
MHAGKNGRHQLVGLLRQSVFGRLTGYEDVNDAERFRRDPAMRWVVGDRAVTGSAASAQMGRFEKRQTMTARCTLMEVKRRVPALRGGQPTICLPTPVRGDRIRCSAPRSDRESP